MKLRRIRKHHNLFTSFWNVGVWTCSPEPIGRFMTMKEFFQRLGVKK